MVLLRMLVQWGEGIELKFTVFMYETTKESKKEWLVLAGRRAHLEEVLATKLAT